MDILLSADCSIYVLDPLPSTIVEAENFLALASLIPNWLVQPLNLPFIQLT